MKISDIIVGKRIRKDLKGIPDLAANIREVGLIHPISVDSENNLLCGLRRLEACKLLGWNDIEAKVFPLDVEADENLHKRVLEEQATNLGKFVCAICGYPLVDEHHIYPKENFIEEDKQLAEEEGNKVYLCTNHHRAVHFLMSLRGNWSENLTKNEADTKANIFKYLLKADPKAYHFYKDTLEPKVLAMEEYYDRKTSELIAQSTSN